MKLIQGTEENRKFLVAMQDEFVLCEQAFDEFFILAGANIQGKDDYPLLERLYKSYTRFVTHLYEFYVACYKRDYGNTKNIPHEIMDKLLTAEVEKLMSNMCRQIEQNRAPSWVNDISYYQEPVPQEFGEKFRSVRNNSSHVDYRRVGGGDRPTLKVFMDNYHKYLFFLYDACRFHWSGKKESPYQGEHIKEFDLSGGKSS